MKKFLLTIASIFIFSTFAFGASFVVNNNGDTNDANTADNLCADSSGNCTLRAAIQQANVSLSDDVITFAANLQTITLTTGLEIPVENAGTLQINGPGANVLTIAGKAQTTDRLFKSNGAVVTIAGLTLTGGNPSKYSGPFMPDADGGAILANGGSLTLQQVNIVDNYAGTKVFMDPRGFGGGVSLNGGTHSIQNSTFSGNTSRNFGGAINNVTGSLTIVNSTISNNFGNTYGGGIYNTGSLIIRNTTIADNLATKASGIFNLGFGGGIANAESGTVEINNTIIAGNTVQNTTSNPSANEIYQSGGAFTSTGNNFIGDSANDSNVTGQPIAYLPTDIRDVPPMLAALGNHGGTTPTRALLPGSPAINAGNNINAPPNDQRGAPRVGAVDIGAYEFGGLTFTISGRVTIDGVNGFGGVTVTLSGSGSASVVTNSNGDYSFSGLADGGNYTVTPSFPNTTFAPPSATINNLNSNQTANFRPQCDYSINPTSASVPSAGGSVTVNVTTLPGCSWTTINNVPFITVTNGSGMGSGTATFTVAANPTASVRTGTLIIADQTFTVTQAAAPAFSINNVSLFEGNAGTKAFTFTVTLSQVLSQTATVNYATVNGTATPPSDYIGTSGTLTFAPGETSKTITVQVVGDTVNEPEETFTVVLSNPVNAIITNGTGTGTIRNDDGSAGLKYDFDGDGKADLAVFRPSNGTWYLQQSTNGFTGYAFGASGDIITPADYDGDGKTDIAVFRPSNGTWYLQQSTAGFTGLAFGQNGDIPVPGDYDGDGKADIAVFRPSNGTWYLQRSQAGFTGIAFGANGDKPVAGDYDGDGKTDLAVFRPSNLTWYIQRSTAGFTGFVFGAATDNPVPADYNGDGKVEAAMFRPSTGYWYTSTDPNQNYGATLFGASGDLPVPADYDGDGRADLAVFRPSNGVWYLQKTTAGFDGVLFGISEDKPIPNAFVR